MSGSSGRIQLVREGSPAYVSLAVHRGGGSYLPCLGGHTRDPELLPPMTRIEEGHSISFPGQVSDLWSEFSIYFTLMKALDWVETSEEICFLVWLVWLSN